MIILLLILLLITSCSKTEVLNAPKLQSVDTLTKAHKPIEQKSYKNTIPQDTTRVPIGFNPSVEEWNNTESVVFHPYR